MCAVLGCETEELRWREDRSAAIRAAKVQLKAAQREVDYARERSTLSLLSLRYGGS